MGRQTIYRVKKENKTKHHEDAREVSGFMRFGLAIK